MLIAWLPKDPVSPALQTGSKYSFDLVEAGHKIGLQCLDTRPGGKIGLQCWAWRRAPSWAPVAGRGVRPRETGGSPSFRILKSRDPGVSTGLKSCPLH